MSDVEVTKDASAAESPEKPTPRKRSTTAVKRGPGRPRKNPEQGTEPASASEASSDAKPKRRPGRPRKSETAASGDSAQEQATPEKPKRRPGRPRKKPVEETAAAEGAQAASVATSNDGASSERGERSSDGKTAYDEAKTAGQPREESHADESSSKRSGEGDSASPRKDHTTVHVHRSRGDAGERTDQRQNDKYRSNHHNKDRQNNQKQSQQKRNSDRKQRRQRNQQNREVVPSVNKEDLAKLKVAELREKAQELELDVSGLKKAELVEAVYEASVKAEGFLEVSGILDIMPDGYGFLRTQGYLPSETDAYVGLSTIRRNGLRKGDMVSGQTRPARENEKYPAIQKVVAVNGVPADEASRRPKFSELTPVYPDERLVMEHGKSTITARVIDLAAPIGKGQRGLIVSPPKAGKTTILKDIAASITANNPEVHLMCLLVDERPEEVTDMERSVRGEVVSSTFDMPCENHIAVAELVVERAKRLVELGQDVVILLDSITRLARAYNLAQPASGRILSGGVDSTALYPPKRFLGAARNIEGGGSLTILASALIDTGSKMDEVIFEEFKGTGNMELKLDRNLADRRIFPAIDPVTSGTRKEDLLLDPQEAPLIWAVRRILSNMNNTERAMDMLIKSLKRTETNTEFLLRTAKKAQAQHGKADENFEF